MMQKNVRYGLIAGVIIVVVLVAFFAITESIPNPGQEEEISAPASPVSSETPTTSPGGIFSGKSKYVGTWKSNEMTMVLESNGTSAGSSVLGGGQVQWKVEGDHAIMWDPKNPNDTQMQGRISEDGKGLILSHKGTGHVDQMTGIRDQDGTMVLVKQ